MPCRADTGRLQLLGQQGKSIKQAGKVQGWTSYMSLPYISGLLSSELDFVFLEELSAQEQKKRRKGWKIWRRMWGKNSWGKRMNHDQVKSCTHGVWTSQVRALRVVTNSTDNDIFQRFTERKNAIKYVQTKQHMNSLRKISSNYCRDKSTSSLIFLLWSIKSHLGSVSLEMGTLHPTITEEVSLTRLKDLSKYRGNIFNLDKWKPLSPVTSKQRCQKLKNYLLEEIQKLITYCMATIKTSPTDHRNFIFT